jgi:hypothetical protein
LNARRNLGDLLQDPDETIAGASRSQIRRAAVAAERDKVEIAASVKRHNGWRMLLMKVEARQNPQPENPQGAPPAFGAG